jgi:T-complex protein 1 subunit delta
MVCCVVACICSIPHHSFQLVDLSSAQDIEAGDGTTSVVVLAGSFLGAAEKMLQKGIHPTVIAESFLKASTKAVEYLTEISMPVDLNDTSSLQRAATTSLNSKVSFFDVFRDANFM